MAIYEGGGLPHRTGDAAVDLENLYQFLYELDQKFIFIFENLDERNFSEGVLQKIKEE